MNFAFCVQAHPQVYLFIYLKVRANSELKQKSYFIQGSICNVQQLWWTRAFQNSPVSQFLLELRNYTKIECKNGRTQNKTMSIEEAEETSYGY